MEVHEHKMNDGPLLTFAVSAYNQERFIRSAIEGAFNQMYSPLEIILSDDCSPDDTFAVMQEMASRYRGPHRILLNRNEVNLGFCGHINRIMDLTSGALVVIAQGDDISLPERTGLVYEAWEYSGRSVTSIYSDHLLIDKSGTLYSKPGDTKHEKNGSIFETKHGDLLSFMSIMKPMVYGCTHAWSRSLFNYFGPLPVNTRWCEDFILTFRSLALNGLLYINKPLIKYRRHGLNFSFHTSDDNLDRKSHAEYDRKLKATLIELAAAYDVISRDIETLRQKNSHDKQYLASVEQEAQRIKGIYALELKLASENFPNRVLTLLDALAHSGLQNTLRFVPQLFPRRQYHQLRVIKDKVLSRFRRGSDFKQGATRD